MCLIDSEFSLILLLGNVNNHFTFSPSAGSGTSRLILVTPFDYERGLDRVWEYRLEVFITDDNLLSMANSSTALVQTGTVKLTIKVIPNPTTVVPTTVSLLEHWTLNMNSRWCSYLFTCFIYSHFSHWNKDEHYAKRKKVHKLAIREAEQTRQIDTKWFDLFTFQTLLPLFRIGVQGQPKFFFSGLGKLWFWHLPQFSRNNFSKCKKNVLFTGHSKWTKWK